MLDGDGNTHNVMFNKSVSRPLLTDGWSALRLFYEFSGSKIIAFQYLGGSRFQIFVFAHNITPVDYPPYHSMSEAPSCYCTFEIPIAGYRSTKSPKELPDTFGKFLRVKHHDYVMLCGPYDNIIPVRLKYTDDPVPNVMFGRGWTSFCAANGIDGGDVLIFKCKCVMDKKYVIISKR